MTLSITTGLKKDVLKEGTKEFKDMMGADVTFQPRNIALKDLKDVVRTYNYSFIHWNKNYRNGANFDFATGIGLDIDEGLSLVDAEAKIRSLNCHAIIATTQTHQLPKKNKSGIEVTCDRYRILIPTVRRFHNYSDLKDAIIPLNQLLGGVIDPAALLASQFFMPSPDNAIIIEIQGTCLYDPDMVNRTGVFQGKDADGYTIVKNAWSLQRIGGFLNVDKVQLHVDDKKQAIYCPFCDDINSNSASAWIPEKDKDTDTRSIVCSHCHKVYVSDIPVLTDDEFLSKIAYTADSIGDDNEPAQWLVQDVLGQSEMFSIFGDPGSGKSYATLQLAISVADPSVKEWLGYEIVRHGPVVYILTDGSHRSLKNRIRRITGFLKIQKPKDLYVLFNQGTFDSWKDDLQRLMEIKKPLLVIIDSLAMSNDKGDENSASDQKELSNLLKTWSLTYNCNISVIHHTSKAAMDRSFHQNNFRGSSHWIGVLSSMLEFRKSTTSKRNTYKLVKSRDGSPEAMNIREVEYVEVPKSSNGQYDLTGEDIYSGYKYIGEAKESKAETKASRSEKPLTYPSEFMMKVGDKLPYNKIVNDIMVVSGKGRTTVKSNLKELVEMGYLERTKEGKSVYYTYVNECGVQS